MINTLQNFVFESLHRECEYSLKEQLQLHPLQISKSLGYETSTEDINHNMVISRIQTCSI